MDSEPIYQSRVFIIINKDYVTLAKVFGDILYTYLSVFIARKLYHSYSNILGATRESLEPHWGVWSHKGGVESHKREP